MVLFGSWGRGIDFNFNININNKELIPKLYYIFDNIIVSWIVCYNAMFKNKYEYFFLKIK